MVEVAEPMRWHVSSLAGEASRIIEVIRRTVSSGEARAARCSVRVVTSIGVAVDRRARVPVGRGSPGRAGAAIGESVVGDVTVEPARRRDRGRLVPEGDATASSS